MAEVFQLTVVFPTELRHVLRQVLWQVQVLRQILPQVLPQVLRQQAGQPTGWSVPIHWSVLLQQKQRRLRQWILVWTGKPQDFYREQCLHEILPQSSGVQFQMKSACRETI